MSKPQLRKWNPVKKIALALIFWLPFILFSAPSSAKTIQEIKAVYLYNFIKFISWPASENQTEFNLCIIGDDPVNEKLLSLNSRPVQNFNLHVAQITQANDENNCQVIFIGESEKKFVSNILSFYAEKPTLTISSVEDFVTKGGIIGFITLGNIIRFDINLKQARETQLSISSKLLELANRVEQ